MTPGLRSKRPRQPKHSVIVAHPHADSFTMTVATAYCDAVTAQGQVAVLRDLYNIGFDPVLRAPERPSAAAFTPALDVKAELDALHGSDIFVLVYPIWFGSPPAMIKGYIERVFGSGFSEPVSGRHLLRPTHPLLGGKHLLSFSSSGSTKQWLEEQGAWASLQTLFGGYLARTFWMSSPEHVHFDSLVDGVGEDIITRNLGEVARKASRMCELLLGETA